MSKDNKPSKELDYQPPADYLEALGHFAGKLGHDFNNVLASIQGCMEIMRNKLDAQYPENNPFERQFKIIESSIRRGTDITTKIRGFLRPGPLQRDRIDAGLLLDALADTITESGATRDDVQVMKHSSAEIEANEFLIIQMLTGLCINSLEAMAGQKDSTLILMLDTEIIGEGCDNELSPGTYVRISIIDHGKGMSEQVRAKLFQPFFSTKGGRVGEGYGLHLPMADGIVRRHGGVLRVKSELGIGTSVQIFLPAAKPVNDF